MDNFGASGELARITIKNTMANRQEKGLKRIYYAFFYSLEGLRATWQYEEAFRQEIVLCIVALPLALWLGETWLEQYLLMGSLVLVLIVELLNSALEAAVDRVGLETHELSARAKDIGSAAVMTSLCWAAVTWVVILLK